MFKMLIDTCVWLDLAKDPRRVPVFGVIEEMVKLGMVTLIVPRVVLDEFRRNRERIAKESAKSLSAHFRLVKGAVGKIGGDKRRMRVVLSHLDDADHKIPIVGGAAADALDRIEKLLTASFIIEPCEAVKLRAAFERAAPSPGSSDAPPSSSARVRHRLPSRSGGRRARGRRCRL
jgi:PIN domain